MCAYVFYAHFQSLSWRIHSALFLNSINQNAHKNWWMETQLVSSNGVGAMQHVPCGGWDFLNEISQESCHHN